MTDDDIDRHIRLIRARENGWSDDPDDSGGPTRDGVTLAMWIAYMWGQGKPPPRQVPYLKEGLRIATDSDLMAFYRWYFRTQGLAELIDEFSIPDELVPLVMDMRTLHSMEGCRKILQWALDASSHMGAGSYRNFSGWQRYGEIEIAPAIIALMRIRYMLEVAERSPKDRKYVRGWMHRALKAIGWWPPKPETREV